MNTTAPQVGDLNDDQNTKDQDLAPQCPDCGSTTAWGMSSWCPDCGYYPAIADHVVTEEPTKEVDVEETETQKPKQWPFFKRLNFGIFAIFLFTALARTFYFYSDADRGLWTLVQVIVGVVTAATAQAITAVYASKENHQFSLASAIINPIEVWAPSFRNNVYQNRLCALIWGITATVLAFAMIGGLTEGHFFKSFNHKQKAQFNVLEEIVNATEGTEGEGEEEEEGVTNQNGMSADEMDQAPKNVLSCAIYGYMTNGGDTITRILLAVQNEDSMQHVGILTAERLGEDKTAALTNMLSTLEIPETSVQTSFMAKWVEPSYTIAIQHDGFDTFGNLKNVRLPEKKETSTSSD